MKFTNSPLVDYTRLTSDRTPNRNHEIDTITIHCYVGQVTAKQGCDYFATSDRQVSSNYVIGYDGSIGLSVEEKDRAWTSGGVDKNGNPIRVNGISGKDNDHRAITIEVASDTTHPYAVTKKAYNSLIKLLVDICKRNNIKKLRWKADKSLVGDVKKQNMTVHRWFSNTACPGDYLYENMGKIASEVNKKLNPDAKPKPVEKPAEKPAEFNSYKVKVAVNALNVRNGAGTKYKVNAVVYRNEVYTIVDEKNGFGKLKSGKGWIALMHTTKL